MRVGDLVYVRQCSLANGATISTIGIIRDIRSRLTHRIMEVWFHEFGYSIDFAEGELISLEDYNEER